MNAIKKQPCSVGLPAVHARQPGSLRRTSARIGLCIGLGLLGACGQKGPLYLPQPPQQALPQSSANPSSAKAPAAAASAVKP